MIHVHSVPFVVGYETFPRVRFSYKICTRTAYPSTVVNMPFCYAVWMALRCFFRPTNKTKNSYDSRPPRYNVGLGFSFHELKSVHKNLAVFVLFITCIIRSSRARDRF